MKISKILTLCVALMILSTYVLCVGFVGKTDSSFVVSNPILLEDGTFETPISETAPNEIVSEPTTVTATTDTPADLIPIIAPSVPAPVENVGGVEMQGEEMNIVTVPAVTVTTPQTTTTTTTAPTTTTTPAPANEQTTTTTTPPIETTTTPPPAPTSSGWTGTLSVKNNLSSSASYGQVVTDDAFTIVCRNVEAEMGASYHAEALKAQALATFSYIKAHGGGAPSLPLSDHISDAVRNACSAVNGLAILYNGAYANAIYGASSGGYTANSNEVWGGSVVPYLVSVPCPVDAQYDRNYGVSSSFTALDIAQRVQAATGITLTGDPGAWFTLERSASGYVTYVNIAGQGRITGQQFRANVMSYKIKSHNMYISFDPGTNNFTITTYGYGHGVGLSQTGAHYYANYNGWNYEQILTHFYTGVNIARVG